jgi:hypothetical protein
VPDCGMRDSLGGVPLPVRDMRFSAKNRGFLTHSRLDATYIGRVRGISLNRVAGSRLRQRRSRVAGDVHNNKEMGP